MGKFNGSAIDYLSVLEAVPQPIAVCNAAGDVLFLNMMARQFLGLKQGDKMPSFQLAQRDTFSQVRIDTTGPLKEYFMADVDVIGAQQKAVSMSLSPIDDERYRVVLEAAPTAMVEPILDELDALVAICDGRRKIQLANAGLNQLLGDLGEKPSEVDLLDLFSSEDRAELRVAASEALAGGTPDEVEARIAVRGVAEGTGRVRVRIRPLRNEEDPRSANMTRGVLMVAQPGEASFLELQRRFARAEKLMSLGELATGVAHELKNPLTSILGYAEYLMKKYRGQFIEEHDKIRLQRIIEGVERIDHFIHDLLKLAGADEMVFSTVNLHSTLRASAELSRRNLRENKVELVWELNAKNSNIRGHQGGLQQVFTNLILNATRAMPEHGGAITIRTRHTAKVVEVEIADTANGMTSETCDRIFEPFFSAAAGSENSGLGLALVRRLVEQHGGQITVESTPGDGTCFTIQLPGS